MYLKKEKRTVSRTVRGLWSKCSLLLLVEDPTSVDEIVEGGGKPDRDFRLGLTLLSGLEPLVDVGDLGTARE